MSEPTAAQAQPIDGRDFPVKARGARPTYFDDDGATDAVVAMVTALTGEVWALRERLANLEALLDRADLVSRADVETYRPDATESDLRSGEAAAFTGRVFRVLEEMREEVLAGEDQDQYLAVVQRAFDELRSSRSS